MIELKAYDDIDASHIIVESAAVSCIAPKMFSISLITRQTVYPSKEVKRICTFYQIDQNLKQCKAIPTIFEVPKEVTLISTSPSGKLQIKVRGFKLELWGEFGVKQVIETAEKFSFIYNDSFFGRIEWAPDESKIAFIGEGKENGKLKDEYEYVDDFGDLLIGKKRPTIYVYYISTNSIEEVSTPLHIYPQCPFFDKLGEQVIFTGLHAPPFKLGLFATPTRPACLYSQCLKTKECIKLTDDITAIGPKFTSDFTKLIYFYQNQTQITHNAYFGIKVIDWQTKEVRIIAKDAACGYQQMYIEQSGVIGDTLYFTSHDQGKMALHSIDLTTSVITDIIGPFNSTELLLASQGVLIYRSSQFSQLPVITAQIDGTQYPLFQCTFPSSQYSSIGHATSAVIKSKHAHGLLYIPENKKPKCPLIVNIHGGPHSDLPDVFSSTNAFLLHQGFAILTANYRGTIGYGQKYLEEISGHIGDYELTDVCDLVNEAIACSNLIDKNNVFLMGISFGGFITCSIAVSDELSKLFKAGAVKNPLTSIADMMCGSDVPEWAFAELRMEKMQLPPKIDLLKECYEKSPMSKASNAKFPIVFFEGEKDKRLPPSAGLHFYKIMRMHGIEAKAFVYPGENHIL